MENFYTTEDAAKFLGVTPARVRQLIMENRLISVKYGRDHLIQKVTLEDFAKNGKLKRGRPRK